MEAAVIVLSWVRPVVSPEGLCHVVDGGSDCAFSQGIKSVAREARFLHCLGEGGEEECATLWFVELSEEVVVVDSNLVENFLPTEEVASSLILCLTCCCGFTGSFSSNE